MRRDTLGDDSIETHAQSHTRAAALPSARAHPPADPTLYTVIEDRGICHIKAAIQVIEGYTKLNFMPNPCCRHAHHKRIISVSHDMHGEPMCLLACMGVL